MEKEESKLKSRELVNLLISKFDKCVWSKLNASTIFELKLQDAGRICIDMKILLVYDKADDLILINEPTAEEGDAHNLASLWSIINKRHRESTENESISIIKYLSNLK